MRRAAGAGVPGTVIDHSPASSGIYIGSPGIAVLPDGTYLAKCDEFGPKSSEKTEAVTRVYRSRDRGRTWTRLGDVKPLFWASLFVHRGAAYLMGPTKNGGLLVIRRSTDGGTTWTEPKDARSGLLLAEGSYHCAPVPVVVHRGRIWRAMEDTMGPDGWGKHFRAFMMSAPADSDLLDAASWTCTNRIGRDPAWLDGTFNGWLEGNAVVDPAGRIVNILRVDVPEGGGMAAIIRVSDDGKEASFDPRTGFIDFPGGSTKFAIRFDPATKLYFSLANYIPPEFRTARPGSIRNTLALIASKDLREWEVRSIIIHHPDPKKHGFQYVDWLFDGEDLIACCRTGYDDGEGGAHNYHDANYLTFHRIERFRERTGGARLPDGPTAGGTP
ncbi:MAG: exo-alpha-sialidase [Planctomycetes bacterium]|nr:exo-alpha-sialidase [Planctomycetota bacterium]